ncbi:VOC family protein [Paraburkholderia kururiensis]|uniref:VOC family protein n=1 Tax=Paraburkholderia kururiensis TaxID=984307 RepID=UPI0030B90476
MRSALNRILLHAKDVQQTCAFYVQHFGFACEIDVNGRIAELVSPQGGAIIMVHQAGKGMKAGQVLVKLVFDVEDVESFRSQCARGDSSLAQCIRRMGTVLLMPRTLTAIPSQSLAGVSP